MPGRKKGPLQVEVIWEDATFVPGWHSIVDVLKDLANTDGEANSTTTGYLVAQSKKTYVLAMSVGAEQIGEIYYIPKSIVRELKRLDVKE